MLLADHFKEDKFNEAIFLKVDEEFEITWVRHIEIFPFHSFWKNIIILYHIISLSYSMFHYHDVLMSYTMPLSLTSASAHMNMTGLQQIAGNPISITITITV